MTHSSATSNTRTARTASGTWTAQIASLGVASILLLLPALWNGFPLLQWDTGGYLARWYEGTLVVSRSTVYGLLLVAAQTPDFWPVVIVQSALAAWIIALVLQTHRLPKPAHVVIAIGLLTALSSLPWLTSMLLTDIFAGLAVLCATLLTTSWMQLRVSERVALAGVIAFAAATHSATLLLLVCLIAIAAIVAIWWRTAVSRRGVVCVAGAAMVGAGLLLAGNYAVARRIAWTPGGVSILWARMLQDGIVGRYLDEHCPRRDLQLCAYKDQLPATADEFLWGGGRDSLFNRLGRFAGLEAEMRTIALESLLQYPAAQAKAALAATARQLVMVGSGEGVLAYLPHTRGIIARFTPRWADDMRAARQNAEGFVPFSTLNAIQIPVALGSLVALLVVVARGAYRKMFGRIETLAAVILLAVVCNAAICGVFSNPHPRYGARLAWLAPLVLMMAVMAPLTRASAAERDASVSVPRRLSR